MTHELTAGKGRARRSQAGFSLIELIVVVTIIGILAGVAIINVRHATRKAQEAALKDNLFQLRKAIDNFYADKQRYPNDLNELVPNYVRNIPADPVTKSADWNVIMDDPTNEGNDRSRPGSDGPAGRDRREEQGRRNDARWDRLRGALEAVGGRR